jgi:hypothetical protein
VATSGGPTDGIGATDIPGGYSTGFDTGWRDGAGKVIVWFGDAVSHTTTVDQAEAIAALNDNDVIVAAINTQGAGAGIDSSGQASAVAAATGGTLSNGVGAGSADDTIDAILDAVADAIATLDLTFATVGDTSGLTVAFTCTDALGCDDVPGGASRTFRVDFTGVTPGRYIFDTVVVGVAGATERDDITVGVVDVPAPASLALFGFALLGLAAAARRRAA